MGYVIQKLAEKINMSFDEFIGEMRKRGCSEPTAIKICVVNMKISISSTTTICH